MNIISEYAIPFVVLSVALFLTFGKKGTSEDFLNGAKSGVALTFRLIPSLILLLVGVSMFTASGATDIFCKLLEPVCKIFGIPAEIMPLVLMRPVSGSGTNALIVNLFAESGPDSFAGRAGSVMLGATDTIFYTFAVYFSAVGIKKSRHALLCAILVEIFAVIAACFLTKLFFY